MGDRKLSKYKVIILFRLVLENEFPEITKYCHFFIISDKL